MNPYIVVKEDKGYVFVTDLNIKYEAYFIKIPNDSHLPIYSFSFEKVADSHAHYDKRVKETIIQILEDFFNENDNAMLFVCDQTDGRQQSRNILFDRWYNEYRETFIKMEYNIRDIYSSVIYSIHNPLGKLIEAEFIKQTQELVSFIYES